MIEGLKIVAMCIVAAVVYGILHDQVTARICVEYITVFHPNLFGTTDPTMLGIGWGIVATWWMGAFLGIILAIASRAGTMVKLSWNDLRRPTCILLIVMAFGATAAGWIGWQLKSEFSLPGLGVPEGVSPSSFYACLFAHNASYFVGFWGGLALCLATVLRRRKLAKHAPERGA